MLRLALLLIMLHRLDGGEVAINPSQITSLHTAATSQNKVVNPDAHCVIGLTDGKLVSVRETCLEVRRLLKGAAD